MEINEPGNMNIKQITKDNYRDRYPFLLADRIVFSSDRYGNENIWEIKNDGELNRLTSYLSLMNILPKGSPDGKNILYSHMNSERNWDLSMKLEKRLA